MYYFRVLVVLSIDIGRLNATSNAVPVEWNRGIGNRGERKGPLRPADKFNTKYNIYYDSPSSTGDTSVLHWTSAQGVRCNNIHPGTGSSALRTLSRTACTLAAVSGISTSVGNSCASAGVRLYCSAWYIECNIHISLVLINIIIYHHIYTVNDPIYPTKISIVSHRKPAELLRSRGWPRPRL